MLLTCIRFINSYSILVVIGSFVMYWFFALLFGLEPQVEVAFVLSLCIWIIYTIDHLLDGKKLREKSPMPRHHSHFKNQRILIVLIIVSCIVSLFLVLFKLKTDYYHFGLGLGLLTALHFVVNHYFARKKSPKRIFKRSIYCNSC